jgi:RHS repeat-associated protein
MHRHLDAFKKLGNVIAVQGTEGYTTSFEYDPMNRKTAVVDAKGYRSEFQYDENGNLTCTIDANGQAGVQPKNTLGCTESRAYDELNRVTKITDALNGETSFTYDLAGNRLTVKDAEAKTWSFAYDDLGRLSSETDHSGKVISYKPDEAGNVYEKTNRLNEVSRFAYDNGNRLTRIDYLKDSTFETFGYDAAGNRNAAANSTVSYAFNWDTLNRLQSKTDSRGKSMSFTFDKVGNTLTKTTYQNSTTSYVYNAANRLVMLRNPDYTQVDYQYDPAGRLLSRVTAAGARASYQYDANGWLSKLSQYDAANALISDTSYTRDRAGNILTQADSSGTTTFTLDALYRLKVADYPGTANDEAFDYDKVGNRKSYTKGALAANTTTTRFYNYTAGTNRLLDIRIGSTTGTVDSSFTHDFEGRLTAQTGTGAKTLTWDAKSRVKTVGTEAYSYDPMDYRIGRSGGTLGNRSYFLEGEHLESEYSGSQLQAKYFRGSSVDELVAAWMYDTDAKIKPFLFHHDQVTSTTAVSGHNGGITQNVKYAAFGTVQSSTGSSPNRLKYTGREEDGTGLMYYRARMYDPAIGRFISEDSLGFDSGDMSFYVYAGNSPINYNDPMGTDPLSALGRVVVKIGGRLGSAETREHIIQVANEWKSKGWELISGGGKPEELIRGATGTAKGGAYGDIVLKNPVTGQQKIINTIDTLADGVTPTVREAANGARIQKLMPDAEFSMVPKPKVIAGVAAAGGAGAAQASDGGIFGTGITWGDVRDFVVDLVVPGGVSQMGGGALYGPGTQYNSYQDYSKSFGPQSGAAAGGGFLLYPNKSNNNFSQSVYSK